MPMWVKVKGGGGGLGSMFGGSPGQFYKGGQFMPGGGRAMAVVKCLVVEHLWV